MTKKRPGSSLLGDLSLPYPIRRKWYSRRQPYRGQPVIQYPPRPKRARDLQGEKQEYTFTRMAITLFAILVLVVGITEFTVEGSVIILFATGMVLFLLTFIALAAADAMKNVNKFRKGYDIDISHRPDEDEE